MEFHEALKELIKLTGCMVKDVSACVQYDQSYISKWLSGVKLPAEKSVNYVIERLSHYFSTIIVENHMEDNLREMVPVPLKLDHAGDVENVVKALLEDGYYRSASLEEGEPVMPMTHRVVTGRNASIQFSLDVITRHLSNHSEREEIVITLDLFNLLPEINLETFNLVMTRPMELTVHTILDLDRQEAENDVRTKSLLAFLNQTINVDYFIYEDTHKMRNNVVIMRGHFVLFYYLDETGKVAACQYLDDPAFVEMAYYDAMAMFDHNKIVLKSTSGQKLRNIDYDLDFVASPPYTLLLSGMMGIFLTKEMLEDQRHLFSEKNFENALFINQMIIQHVYSKTLLIITSRSYLLNFFKTGRVFYLGQTFHLSKKQRGAYIRSIIRALQTNPNLRLYVTQDDLAPYHTSKINLSLAMTDNKALIIKTPEALYNNRLPYYMVTSQRLIDILNRFGRTVSQMQPIRKFTREDTEELLEHYLNMFRL